MSNGLMDLLLVSNGISYIWNKYYYYILMCGAYIMMRLYYTPANEGKLAMIFAYSSFIYILLLSHTIEEQNTAIMQLTYNIELMRSVVNEIYFNNVLQDLDEVEIINDMDLNTENGSEEEEVIEEVAENVEPPIVENEDELSSGTTL